MMLRRYSVCLMALACVICLVGTGLCQPSRPKKASINETIERQAIKQVIRNEHECFLRNDFDCWKEYRVQTEDVSLYLYDGKSIISWEGWSAIEMGARQFLANSQILPNLETYEQMVEQSNWRIHFFSPTIASVTWDQYSKKSNYRSKEARTLLRDNGKWKVAIQVTLTLPTSLPESQ